jgi:hypothetical protein
MIYIVSQKLSDASGKGLKNNFQYLLYQ